jgi:hypothetical protein
MIAMRARFAMIDVARSQAELRKSGKSKALSLTNEVKVITSSDETFKLWQEVISAAAHGDLVDVDKEGMPKYKDVKNWVPAADGMLNREFFKFLGNMSETDHAKMCKHILGRSGPSRKLAWPKVTIKQPTSFLEDSYSAKEWAERRKRKEVARMELHNLYPELRFFNSNGEYNVSAWKEFKKNFYVTKASKRVLLDWGPGESFYRNSMQTQFRNTSCEELSPYAREFFRVFHRVRKNFYLPTGAMHYRVYKAETNSLGTWPSDSWQTLECNVKLGIIDFRNIPGFTAKSRSSDARPFFEEFMNMFSAKRQPLLTDLPAWLFICGDMVTFSQVEAFAAGPLLSEVYSAFPSEYVPAANERLGGHPAKSKLALDPVRMLFLFKNELNVLPAYKKLYKAPEHIVYEKPRKYNELEYAMYPNELRMEFFIKILEVFCKSGESVFQMFGGTKLLTATVVSFHYCLARIELHCCHHPNSCTFLS